MLALINGEPVSFPSMIIEVCAEIIMFIIFRGRSGGKNHGQSYRSIEIPADFTGADLPARRSYLHNL